MSDTLEVTIYKTQHCTRCMFIERFLTTQFSNDNVKFNQKDMTDDDLNLFTNKGFYSSPVVEVDGEYYAAVSKQDTDKLISAIKAALLKNNL